MVLCVGLYAYRTYEGIFEDNWKNIRLAWLLFVGLSAVGQLFIGQSGMCEAQFLRRCHFRRH